MLRDLVVKLYYRVGRKGICRVSQPPEPRLPTTVIPDDQKPRSLAVGRPRGFERSQAISNNRGDPSLRRLPVVSADSREPESRVTNDSRLGRRDGSPIAPMTTRLCDNLSCLLRYRSWRQYLAYRRLSPRTPQEPRFLAVGRPRRILEEPSGLSLMGEEGPRRQPVVVAESGRQSLNAGVAR